FKLLIKTLMSNNKVCKCPSGRACKHYNIGLLYPKLCREWDYDQNKLKPENYLPNSNKKVWWKCIDHKKCDCHVWPAIIYNRTAHGTGCPFCNGDKQCQHNNLLARFTIICKDWNYEKNKKLPTDYKVRSGIKVWWKCHKHKGCDCHVWPATIDSRTGPSKAGCPFCSNRRRCPHNNVGTQHPEILGEWDYEKNELLPKDLSRASNEKIWWKCKNDPCGCHKWKAGLPDRTKSENPTGCPFCAGKRTCKHNNLALSRPDLCKEWNFEKNEKSPDN